ncbi:MAG: cell division protein ZapA [Parasphingorhabdus sp.]|nr:cell division protein ZapA [Parasphingorhabdus sp.]
MAEVALVIGGRNFSVNCQDGEEAHISKLAIMIDQRAKQAGNPAALTENRMLLFAALMLADDLHGVGQGEAPQAAATQNSASDMSLTALENLAERVEQFAERLEHGNNNA